MKVRCPDHLGRVFEHLGANLWFFVSPGRAAQSENTLGMQEAPAGRWTAYTSRLWVVPYYTLTFEIATLKGRGSLSFTGREQCFLMPTLSVTV